VIAPKYQPLNTNSQTHLTILGQHLQGRSHGVYKDGKIKDSSNQNGEKNQLCFHYPSLIKQNEWLLKEWQLRLNKIFLQGTITTRATRTYYGTINEHLLSVIVQGLDQHLVAWAP
jgi:hypothetical protein